jgi:hypothetical protein
MGDQALSPAAAGRGVGIRGRRRRPERLSGLCAGQPHFVRGSVLRPKTAQRRSSSLVAYAALKQRELPAPPATASRADPRRASRSPSWAGAPFSAVPLARSCADVRSGLRPRRQC